VVTFPFNPRVYKLTLALLLIQATGLSEGLPPTHDEENQKPRATGNGNTANGGECGVAPDRLAKFANGDNYDYKSMVTFLTQPECLNSGKQISAAAIATGVSFKSSGPWNLTNYASLVPSSDIEGRSRIDENLAKQVPILLREDPLGQTELLPMIGQLALLSPKAARASLVNLIEQQLYAADPQLRSNSTNTIVATATNLAKSLTRLGAAEPLIATEMADNIEELAILSQADSLEKIFRGLGISAIQDASLANTFNLSADAFNRGIQRGKNVFQKYDKQSLTQAVFSAIRAAIAGNELLETGAGELNEALAALIAGQPLPRTKIAALWKEVLKILSESTSQPTLAQAFALGLTPSTVLLPKKEMALMIKSCRNYPVVAVSLESNFLFAWKDSWDNLHDGKLTVGQYNEMKTKIYEPVVVSILDLGPSIIDPKWLKAVLERGLVSDKDIETRFPRYVLALLGRREKASREAASNPNAETAITSMAENFRVLWTLSNVHIPALMKWVKKFDE
jgi:hypothetical protein